MLLKMFSINNFLYSIFCLQFKMGRNLRGERVIVITGQGRMYETIVFIHTFNEDQVHDQDLIEIIEDNCVST